MVFPGSRFHSNARWTDRNVWDTDFVDPAVNSQGDDEHNFDMPGTAVSYFTGHGFCNRWLFDCILLDNVRLHAA